VSRLLVGTDSGLFEFGDEQKTHLTAHAVGQVVAAKRGWWCIVDRTAVSGWSPESGWVELRAPVNVSWTCLLPVDGGLIGGTVGAHLVRLETSVPQPFPSFDEVPGREDWYTPWGAPPDARSLAEGDGVLLVNVHVGGIPRATDGGDTWTPTIDVDVDVHQVVTAGGGRAFAACGAGGLAVSDDAGRTWSMQTDGLHATYCRAVAIGDDTVFVSASRGPRGDHSAVYRWAFGADRFERCTGGLPDWFDANIDTFCLAAADGEVALGTGDGRVFRSGNGGSGWEQAAESLPAVRSLAFS